MSDKTDAQKAYEEIQERIGPNVLNFFGHRAMDYNSGPAFMFLGVKGQFGDINRKFWKLYKALWLDQELVGEQPIEILYDFIGHCLLTIWLLEQDDEEAGRDKQFPQMESDDTLDEKTCGDIGQEGTVNMEPDRCPECRLVGTHLSWCMSGGVKINEASTATQDDATRQLMHRICPGCTAKEGEFHDSGCQHRFGGREFDPGLSGDLGEGEVEEGVEGPPIRTVRGYGRKIRDTPQA